MSGIPARQAERTRRSACGSVPDMATRCDQCGKKLRGGGHQTFTRTLCASCNDAYMGAAAGLIAGGDVETGIATAGWYQRIRKLTRRER